MVINTRVVHVPFLSLSLTLLLVREGLNCFPHFVVVGLDWVPRLESLLFVLLLLSELLFFDLLKLLFMGNDGVHFVKQTELKCGSLSFVRHHVCAAALLKRRPEVHRLFNRLQVLWLIHL